MPARQKTDNERSDRIFIIGIRWDDLGSRSVVPTFNVEKAMHGRVFVLNHQACDFFTANNASTRGAMVT